MTYIWPLPAGTRITQSFGSFPGGYNPAGGHTGTDFAVPTGTPVRAAGAGRVVFADWATTLPADYRADGSGPNPYWLAPAFGGIVVVIDHGAGQPVSIYAHLSKTDLNKGNTVAQGQVIGLSGATGGASSGPHLHFEMLPDRWNFNNGTYGRVNPATFCKAYWSPAPALKANQRVIGSANVNLRSAASKAGKILKVLPAKSTQTFVGYVLGERINGKNLWYKSAEGYAHCDGFTTQVTTGLPDLTPKPAPAPAPKPVVVAPKPVPVPAPTPAPVPAVDPREKVIKDFQDWQREQYLKK